MVIDQDGRGEGGSPAIPDVIQGKIQNAVAFVADLSIVARRPTGGGLTNGCVAVEWGWAEESLGSAAVVGVMNTVSGVQADLPIDIRQNLVRAVFELPEGADADARREARDRLTGLLNLNLTQVITNRYYAGLHPASPMLVSEIVRSSAYGLRSDYFDSRVLAEQIRLEVDEVDAIVEDLVRLGLAKVLATLGQNAQAQFLPDLFVRFDPLYMGWNADRDAVTVAQAVVEQRRVKPKDLCAATGWSPRRLNPALWRLIANDIVLHSRSVGDQQFCTAQVDANNNTRAFAEGRLELPSPLMRSQFYVYAV